MSARVDEAGIVLDTSEDAPYDVWFGDNRLWSFNPARDGRFRGEGRLVPWPEKIRERLVGTAHVRVVAHLEDRAVYDAETVFAGSAEPLEFVDELGHPLNYDKGGHFQRSFDRMDADSKQELVVGSMAVLEDLRDHCGLDAFVYAGSLLGAVRGGHMIGNDSDIDLAYYSRFTHPFDIIREARRAERQLRDRGWRVVRMSAANFKVWVELPSGKKAGVDVFAGFHIGETYHNMANLRGSLRPDQVLPLTTVTLEGTEFPAPADPEAFLELLYGPHWRVPDPSFKFTHPPHTITLMSQYFRGSRTMIWYWQKFYKSSAVDRIPREESRFAHWVHERVEPGSRIVELGSGTGRDAVWLQRQGHDVTGSEYVDSARGLALRRAREEGLDLKVRRINVESLQSLLTAGHELAAEGTPTHTYARLVVDALAPNGRDGLWRFCSMVSRRGRTYVEFRTARNRGVRWFFGSHPRHLPTVETVVAEIERRGGRVLDRQTGRGLAPLGSEDPFVCRLEVSWT